MAALPSRPSATASPNSQRRHPTPNSKQPPENHTRGGHCQGITVSVQITNSYEDAIKIIEVFHEYSRRSGVEINLQKSGGIRLLAGYGAIIPDEMPAIRGFKYLNYFFSRDGVSIAQKRELTIKRTISKIIYNNLLIYLMRGKSFNEKRIIGQQFDWDLVTCINEIRRFIYGYSSERKMLAYLNNEEPLKKAKGVMAFFCLIDNKEQIRAMDGWLVDSLCRALKHRGRLLNAIGISYSPPARKEIIEGTWYSKGMISMETRCPSFYTAWRVAKKRWEQVGAGGIMTEDFGYE